MYMNDQEIKRCQNCEELESIDYPLALITLDNNTKQFLLCNICAQIIDNFEIWRTLKGTCQRYKLKLNPNVVLMVVQTPDSAPLIYLVGGKGREGCDQFEEMFSFRDGIEKALSCLPKENK